MIKMVDLSIVLCGCLPEGMELTPAGGHIMSAMQQEPIENGGTYHTFFRPIFFFGSWHSDHGCGFVMNRNSWSVEKGPHLLCFHRAQNGNIGHHLIVAIIDHIPNGQWGHLMTHEMGIVRAPSPWFFLLNWASAWHRPACRWCCWCRAMQAMGRMGDWWALRVQQCRVDPFLEVLVWSNYTYGTIDYRDID